jgi:hypothetical protein
VESPCAAHTLWRRRRHLCGTGIPPQAVIYVRADPDDGCLSVYGNAKVSLTTFPPTITVRSRLRHTSYYSDAGGVCQASSSTATTLQILLSSILGGILI